MPHIHLHLHDSGTSEGARKAAQTRKMHEGAGTSEGTGYRSSTASFPAGEAPSKANKGKNLRPTKTRFVAPRVTVQQQNREYKTHEKLDAGAARREARQMINELTARHKGVGKPLSGEEHGKLQRLRRMYGG